MVRSRVRAVVAVLASGAAITSATLVSGAAAERAPVRQSASLEAPAVTYVNQQVELRAGFRPARKGRKVQLQVKQGRRWRTIDTARQNRRGRVRFDLAARRRGPVKVRTRAVPHRGLVAVTSPIRRIRVKRDRVAITDTFHALTPREAALSTYDPRTGRLVFDRRATSAIRTLAKGDLLTLPPTDGIASGALVEVTRVRETRRGVEARTRSASLADAVQNVPDDATSFAVTAVGAPRVEWTAPGVTVDVASARGRVPYARLETFEGPTVSVSVSGKADLPTGLDLTHELSLSLTPMGQLELDFDWGHLESYKVGAGAGVNAAYAVSVGQKGAAEIPLTRVGTTFKALVGWVPVWMETTSEIVLVVSAEGRASLRLVSGGPAVLGLQGDKDSSTGLFPVPYLDLPDTETSVGAGLKAKLEAGPKDRTQFSLYSVGGPFLDMGIVAGVKVEAATETTCAAYTALKGSIGLASSAFVDKLVGDEHETTIGDVSAVLREVPLDCGLGDAPTPSPSPTSSPTGTPTPTETPTPDPDPLRVLAAFLPKGYQYDAYSSLLVASEPGGTWRVADGLLPPGITLETDGSLTGAPTGAPGTYAFTVEVDVDGRTATRGFEIEVEPVTTYASIDVSGGMACGLSSAGDASCWWHQLFFNPGEGDGSSLRSHDKSTIDGPFESIAGTCGLRPDGTATCWTGNRYTWDYNDEMDVVEAPGTFREVMGDSELGCGVHLDGSAECWTIPMERHAGPQPGTLPGTWDTVDLDGMVCGIREDGTGACFPDGWDSPVEVPASWVATRAGDCGLEPDGTASCLWDGVREPADGMSGQWSRLGSGSCGIRPDGDLECAGTFEEHFRLEGPWTSISGSCALKGDGTGWCWGVNYSGQVGNGTREDAPLPVQLPGTWTQLVSSGTESCGLQVDGTGWCWGNSPDRTPQPWHPPVRLVPTRVQSGP